MIDENSEAVGFLTSKSMPKRKFRHNYPVVLSLQSTLFTLLVVDVIQIHIEEGFDAHATRMTSPPLSHNKRRLRDNRTISNQFPGEMIPQLRISH